MHSPALPWSRIAFPVALLAGLLVALLRTASSDDPRAGREIGASDMRSVASSPGAAASPRADAPRVVFLGDSLTAGHGVSAAAAYPALVGQKIQEAGLGYRVINAGISGDTSAGALRRMEPALAGEVKLLVVAIGCNDGLRGLSTEQLRLNLEAIVGRAIARGVPVALVQMEIPSNYGPEYTGKFREVYRAVADRHGVPLLPFLLDGVAMDPGLNLPDGIHPNEMGHRVIADTVWRSIEPLLAHAAAR